MQTAHEQALSKAKIALMARPDSVFYVTLAFSLRHRFDDGIPTACTNGREIRYNPDFFMQHTPEERVGLIIHETMHVAYLHMDPARRGSRDPSKWNSAADYVINLQITERGFQIPPNGLLDAQYKGMGTEEVYDRLPASPPPPPMPDLESGDSGDGDPAAAEQLRQDVQDILVRAALQSKMAGDKPGTIPGDIEIFLDKLLNPKLPWQAILRKYLHSFNKNDYTFRKPNRRYFPAHYLPSLYSEALANVDWAVDASASVADHEFGRFVSEIGGVFRQLKPESSRLLTFDTTIRSVDTIRNVQELQRVKFTGRGGTSIRPVLEWANAHKPKVLLIFTDGEFRWPSVTTRVPVIWLIHNNPSFTAPFGKVIHYEV